MKKLVFMLVTVPAILFVSAKKISEKEVPVVVTSALKKHYPDAKELKWEKENSNYEAAFKMAKTAYSLLIDTAGHILETEVEISIKEVPADVNTYLLKHYKEQKIKEVAKITDNKGIVTYEIEVKGKDLIFDNSGKFLKEEKD
ncbi:PepSY-like domain-containing protein [Polluticaenibacter yanchengensis]|uniref:Putative beta-lactamase-inhibitor-like PepSY-like domain-containing protein n=1 Tax=Polluticaenibacter yanchengensis TaxID=3014562 RepID=A0ABT4UI92_9BACT|nr:hypothetical protein [Chitinophagaceae bacterium LY-5]